MPSAGYKMEELLKEATSQTIGASKSDIVVSNIFRLSAEDSKFIIVRVETSSITLANAITAELHTSYDGTNFVNSGLAVSITSNSNFGFIMKASDSEAPLMPQGRIHINTGVGDAITIDSVLVSRRL